MKYKIVLLALVMMIAILTSCRSHDFRPPEAITRQDAESILRHAETLAHSDVQGLCAISFSPDNCRQTFQRVGGDASIPELPAEVINGFVLPDTTLPSGSVIRGGYVLVVSGVNGLGEEYRTEFLVFDTGIYGLKPQDAIYWSGISVRAGDG